MILMILDFKGRNLGGPSSRSFAKPMFSGAPEGGHVGACGLVGTKAPPGYLRFPKEKQWFCACKPLCDSYGKQSICGEPKSIARPTGGQLSGLRCKFMRI